MILSDSTQLNPSSREKILAKCDICGVIYSIGFYSYMRNFERGGFFSCKKCSSVKRKSTMVERYGVENSMFSDDIKNKIKSTNIERYGVENVFQSNIIKDRIKSTNIERYGHECSMSNEIIKDKIKKTNIEKYGHEHHMKSDDVKNKIKNTNIDKYGVANVFQSDDVKKKIKNTNLKKYGFECSLNSDVVKEKIKNTNIEKYGHEHHMKSDDVKNKIKNTNIEKYGVVSYSKTEEYHLNTNIGKDINYLRYLDNSISLFKCDVGHEFKINIDNYIGRKRKNLPLCTVCNPVGDSKSIKEQELSKFIESIYKSEIIRSYRDGLEIDVYLTDLKLGFEFNGLYWHSEEFKGKNYHLDKTNYFKERGIRIIHIWEDDWDFKKDIVKSQIQNWLGLTKNKIFARKCEVKELVSDDTRLFLDNNHLQGFTRSNLKLGLYYDGELVSLMTFDHFEGRNKMEEGGWNLNRFCNVLNTNVIGSASKLFKFFLKNYNVKRIISYADNDWSIGDLYHNLEFEDIHNSKPDYKYIVHNRRVHKSRYKKDNLNLEDKTKVTESQVMSKRGIHKIWDCGKIKFEKIYEI